MLDLLDRKPTERTHSRWRALLQKQHHPSKAREQAEIVRYCVQYSFWERSGPEMAESRTSQNNQQAKTIG